MEVVQFLGKLTPVIIKEDSLDYYIRLQVHMEAYGKSMHGLFLVGDNTDLPKLLSDPKLHGVAIRP